MRKARRRLGLRTDRGPAPPVRNDGLYSTRGLAELFGVKVKTVKHWERAGWLEPVEPGARGRTAWYRLDDETIQHIRSRSRAARGLVREREGAEEVAWSPARGRSRPLVCSERAFDSPIPQPGDVWAICLTVD